MVAMAGDSYLLKVPAPPCQGQHCQRNRASDVRSSTSCGVVVSLVLLLGAVLGLAGMAYYLRVELCVLRSEVQSQGNRIKDRDQAVRQQIDFLSSKISEMDVKLDRINVVQQMKIFENERPAGPGHMEDDTDFDSDEEIDDPVDLVYDDREDDFTITNRAGPVHERPDSVPKLEPAGNVAGRTTHSEASTLSPQDVTATTPGDNHPRGDDDDGDEDEDEDFDEFDSANEPAGFRVAGRSRREVGSASFGSPIRPPPQLKLYHTLQTPMAAAPPPPAEVWSYHGTRSQPQSVPAYALPAYAEHAPMDFVPPPRHYTTYATSTAAPVANRRSRVLDAGDVQTPHRHHHRHRAGQAGHQAGWRQRLQQEQQPHGAYGAYGGYGGARYQDAQHVQQAQHSPYGGPEPAVWRGARVTDTFHH